MKISRFLLRALPLLTLFPFVAAASACSESLGDESPGDGDGATGGTSGDGDGATGGTSGDGDATTGGMSGDGDTGGTSGDGDGLYSYCSPADTCPPSVEGVDLTTPVSFRNDIYLPYLQGSCGELAGCHGTAPGVANIYLSASDQAPLDDAQISALIMQLTTTQSEIAPTQKNVVPGDWENSFLMAKLDGCQNSYGLTCNKSSAHLLFSVCGETCGDGMPASEGTPTNPTPFATTAEQRVIIHKIRAWIQQGAQDN